MGRLAPEGQPVGEFENAGLRPGPMSNRANGVCQSLRSPARAASILRGRATGVALAEMSGLRIPPEKVAKILVAPRGQPKTQ
jgi:hypothetical protein